MSTPTLKLYYAAQTRAGRTRWMLEEIGVPYELVRLDLWAGDQKTPAYRALNPNGTVPTLIDDDLVVFESAAIVQHLADRFPEKRLAPAVGTPARGKYYQWIHYAMSSLEPPAVTIFLHTTGTPVGRQHERIPQLVPEARAQLTAALQVTDAALAGRAYILSDEFSAADIMIGSMAAWCLMLGMFGNDMKDLQAYVSRVASRPAFLRAQLD